MSTEEDSLKPEDVRAIIEKIIHPGERKKLKIPKDFPKLLLKNLSREELVDFISKLSPLLLEYYHALAHDGFETLGDEYCKFHFVVASEMISRGYPHIIRTSCDSLVELIKNWRKYSPKDIQDDVLRDDWRIVNAWMSTLEKGKKFETDQFKGMTLEQQKNVVKGLAEKIRNEMKRRGWEPKELAWKPPKGFRVDDIDPNYLEDLSDEEVTDIYQWIHRLYKSWGRITEELENANIFVGIDLLKRGIYTKVKIDDPLTDATDLEIQEYPTAKGLAEPEGEFITFDDFKNALRAVPAIRVQGQPWAGYVGGRLVNEGKIPKDHDIDIVVRQKPDPRTIASIKRALPHWLARRIHVVFDPHGPEVGYSVPIWNYGYFLTNEEEMARGFGPFRVRELSVLKPGTRFRPLKQKSGWEKFEFWQFEDLWKNWASKHISDGIYCSKKYDGRSFIIWVLQDGEVRIITEDQMRDRSADLPNVVEELRKKYKGHIVAFHAEAVGYDTGGKTVKSADMKEDHSEEIPREDTAWLTVAKKITPEQENSIVFHVHDMVYYDEDLSQKPYGERVDKVVSLVRGMRFLNWAESRVVKTLGAFKSAVRELSKLKGSEGVFFRSAKATYPIKTSGENRSPLLAKIKNMKSVDVMVWNRIQKKGQEGQWVYETVYQIPCNRKGEFKQTYDYQGKCFAYLGKTFGTNVKCERGDIIEVLVGRIRKYETKTKDKIYYTWMFPKFKEKREEKTVPDNLGTIEKIAKVGPGVTKLHELSYSVRLRLCPYYTNLDICRLRAIFGRPRYDELSAIKFEHLKFPVICPLASLYRCRYLKKYYYGEAEFDPKDFVLEDDNEDDEYEDSS